MRRFVMNGSEQVWRNPDAGLVFCSGPHDAGLSAEELSAVLSVLRPFAGNQDSFFRFSEIAFIETDKPIQFCGTLDELSTFLANGKYQFTPEYWWPADHSGCVCSDYDLTFTIVAGWQRPGVLGVDEAPLPTMQENPENHHTNHPPTPQKTTLGSIVFCPGGME